MGNIYGLKYLWIKIFMDYIFVGHVKIDTTKVYTDHLTDTMSKEGLNVLMNIYKK